MGQHLSFTRIGKATHGSTMSRSEPDWGNPTVRERRGARGTVAVRGVGLRAAGKPVELPPNPTAVRAPYFYPDQQEACSRRVSRREDQRAHVAQVVPARFTSSWSSTRAGRRRPTVRDGVYRHALHKVTNSASSSCVKPHLGRANDTVAWLVLPHGTQPIRGTSASMKAWYGRQLVILGSADAAALLMWYARRGSLRAIILDRAQCARELGRLRYPRH